MRFDNGREIVNVNGHLVEKDVLGIVERIRAYDSHLDVLCLDPTKADFCDAPFIVVELCNDGHWRRVFEVWELDERVLQRVWAADTAKHDVQGRLEKANELARQEVHRRYQEASEESKDIVAHIFASAKGTYTFQSPASGKLVEVNDDPARQPVRIVE